MSAYVYNTCHKHNKCYVYDSILSVWSTHLQKKCYPVFKQQSGNFTRPLPLFLCFPMFFEKTLGLLKWWQFPECITHQHYLAWIGKRKDGIWSSFMTVLSQAAADDYAVCHSANASDILFWNFPQGPTQHPLSGIQRAGSDNVRSSSMWL